MDWTQIILTLIATLGGGGGLLSVLTIRAQRKKADAEADSVRADNLGSVIDALRKVIDELTEERTEGEKKIDKLAQELTEKDKRINALYSENMTKGNFLCMHLGCPLRRPKAGRGHEYFKAHASDEGFGADYMGLDELLEEYHLRKAWRVASSKHEDENEDNQEDGTKDDQLCD